MIAQGQVQQHAAERLHELYRGLRADGVDAVGALPR